MDSPVRRGVQKSTKEDGCGFLLGAGDVPRRVVGRRLFASLDSTNKPWFKQVRALCQKGAAWSQEGPGGLNLDLGGRRALSTSESPQKTKQHSRESQNIGTKKMQSAFIAALHRKVPLRQGTTQRVVRRRMECWGPGLRCAQRILGRSAQKPKELQKTCCKGVLLQHGEASSYLHQIWTAGPLDSLGHFGPPPVFQGAHSSSGEESQSTGHHRRRVPAEAGK
ncbi:hypothetical protein NDU88_007366 [Pleurodeles waltl]|uniref:Uncharacterized protein n=1 Tax=Pleurodeles waltl TaxID=8319 RepID=A0AAV7US31_PLEWA|nr:hypothetical protein NDU88_007366 [Pleurodeles waltl]